MRSIIFSLLFIYSPISKDLRISCLSVCPFSVSAYTGGEGRGHPEAQWVPARWVHLDTQPPLPDRQTDPEGTVSTGCRSGCYLLKLDQWFPSILFCVAGFNMRFLRSCLRRTSVIEYTIIKSLPWPTPGNTANDRKRQLACRSEFTCMCICIDYLSGLPQPLSGSWVPSKGLGPLC